MGYFGADGRYRDTDEVTLRASAVLSASAAGAWVEIGDRAQLRLTLTVSAVSGTSPTLDVDIETASDSAGSNLATIGSFSQQTAAGSQRLIFDACDRFARIKSTLGGSASPSVTFAVAGEAV